MTCPTCGAFLTGVRPRSYWRGGHMVVWHECPRCGGPIKMPPPLGPDDWPFPSVPAVAL